MRESHETLFEEPPLGPGKLEIPQTLKELLAVFPLDRWNRFWISQVVFPQGSCGFLSCDDDMILRAT